MTVLETILSGTIFVDQDLMDRAAGPGTTKIGSNSTLIERISNLLLRLLFRDERPVYPADGFDFLGWARDEYNPIGLDALVLASCKLALRRAVLINQAAP